MGGVKIEGDGKGGREMTRGSGVRYRRRIYESEWAWLPERVLLPM